MEGVDRTRRDGFQPQQWNGFLARQVCDERVVLSILFGEPRLVKVPSFVGADTDIPVGLHGKRSQRFVHKECSQVVGVVFVV